MRTTIMILLVILIGYQPGESNGSPVDVEVIPDIVYGRESGLALTMDLYRPAHPNGGAVVYVNSGGFVSGQIRQHEVVPGPIYRFIRTGEMVLAGQNNPIPLLDQFTIERFLEAGLTVFDVRHGSNSRFTLDEITEQIKRAIRVIRLRAGEFGVDKERIGIFGASSGGYLAIFAGITADKQEIHSSGLTDDVSSNVRTVAVYYPAGYDFASDVKRFPFLLEALPALDIERDLLDSLSLRHHISPDDPPLLILYGDVDHPFIVEPSESVYTDYLAHGLHVERIIFPGVGHEFVHPESGYDDKIGRRANEKVAAWFRRWLASPDSTEDDADRSD